MYEELISQHTKTINYYANRYRYLSDSQEDMYQDLVCQLIVDISKYSGSTEIDNSLITLFIKRYVSRLIDKKYGNRGLLKLFQYIPFSSLSTVDNRDFVFGEDCYVYDCSDLALDLTNFEGELLIIAEMIVAGYSKKEIKIYFKNTLYKPDLFFDVVRKRILSVIGEYSYGMQTV